MRIAPEALRILGRLNAPGMEMVIGGQRLEGGARRIEPLLPQPRLDPLLWLIRFCRGTLQVGGKTITEFLIVRAEVDPAARDAFDTWYQNEHLPDAVKAFSAAGAWRGWSDLDDNVHIAFCEFADLAEVNRVMASDGFKQTIGEFDRHWQGKVTRTHEVVESIQAI